MILDSLAFTVMVYIPMMVGSMAGDGPVAMVGLALMLVGFIAWVAMTIHYVRLNSQSIGKKLAGIKVVRSDGSPISFGRLFWLRNGVNALISIVPGYGLIDALFIFGESRQCLHDKLADTIVVKA